ncbi:13298_t:CDS:1 [Ambispora leptoticha]|uniref:13298_t:CDS:1 n=1 Tax=Ambispora leptoticha TaxID=144679 RepID=A0A9N9E6B8_9GLOM|nr:13298_t:CDS:1 [Ambispora leptoticha]
MEKASISQTALSINNNGTVAPKRNRRNTAPAGFYSAARSPFATFQQEEPNKRTTRFQKRLRKPPSFETYLERGNFCNKNEKDNDHVPNETSNIDDDKESDKYSIKSSFSSETNKASSITRFPNKLEDIKDDEPGHLGDWDLLEDESEDDEDFLFMGGNSFSQYNNQNKYRNHYHTRQHRSLSLSSGF